MERLSKVIIALKPNGRKAIDFADPGIHSQRALNENFNGLLRKDGLPKEMDFNQVDQSFISSVADK